MFAYQQGVNLISVSTDSATTDKQPYLLQPLKSLPTKKGIMGAATVAQISNREATLRVFNPHYNDINLAMGQLVASASGLQTSEITAWSEANDEDHPVVNVVSDSPESDEMHCQGKSSRLWHLWIQSDKRPATSASHFVR